MLSSVLRSPRAVAANIEIVRTFIRLRSAVLAGKELAERVRRVEQTQISQEKELGEHATEIHEVFAAIRDLSARRTRARQKKPL
jgi:cell division protein FtsB